MLSLPTYLASTCNLSAGVCRACAEPVAQATTGRWYITIGHAGFNSTANNRNGYATRAAAVAAHRKYAGK